MHEEGGEDDEGGEEGDPVDPEILSPGHGRKLSAPPWVPLLARLPVGVDSASARIQLDGQPWSDPLMVIRPTHRSGSSVQ